MADAQHRESGQESLLIETYDECMEKQDAQVAAARQASYAYRHANERYGGGRSLRVPDGDIRRAHYVYAPHSTGGHQRTRHDGRQRSPRHTVHPHSHGQRDGSWAPYGGGSNETGHRDWFSRFWYALCGYYPW